MRRFATLLGLALVAVFATGAALSAVAFADETPLNLPFSGTRTWTGEAEGEPKFNGAAGVITCQTATAEGNEETNLPPLGTFHIHFKNCTAKEGIITVKCTGLGETETGTILVLGTWHLVWDEEKEKFELHTATLFLNEPVHFTCGGIVLVEVKGEQLCLDLESTVSKAKHSFHCIPTVAGGTTQNDAWCEKDVSGKCVGLHIPLLLSSKNHETFKESAEEALGNATYGEPIATMTL